jgi:glycosyltransferase involved in cell wall biosynthesis
VAGDRIERLLVVSHVVHYEYGGCLHAYGPYAREIDIWADLFPTVAIAAPVRREKPPGDCLPFTRPNIELVPQLETGGTTALAKARQALAVPQLLYSLGRAMMSADAIHVRCPGNLGLLGLLCAPLFSRYVVAKYAGQWTGRTEAWTVGLQRMILRSRWWRGPVTVYGRWANQPSHIVPFFTSILDEAQLARARAAARPRKRSGPLRVLYVGRLSRSKNVHVLVAAVAKLRREGLDLRAEIIGEGPEATRLAGQIEAEGLAECVRLGGSVAFNDVLDYYERSDVLVLASETEGWPKAIAEGMAFGLVCIGSTCGFVPEMLEQGRGLCVPPGDAEALAAALRGIAGAPAAYDEMRCRAAAWAGQYSLEGLRSSLRDLLRTYWHWEPRSSTGQEL